MATQRAQRVSGIGVGAVDKRRESHRINAVLGHLQSTGFDYIVVGGGTAGCVMASRLSEDKDVSVCLLEAGPDTTTFLSRTPVAFNELQMGALDWKYRSTPQRHTFDRVSLWPRGKIMGGCSTSNAMFWIRCDPRNYDEWEAMGCRGWDYKSVLPFFKKCETCRSKGVKDKSVRGDSGPMIVADLDGRGVGDDESSLWHKRLANTAQQALDLPHNDDFNGRVQEGAGVCECNIHNGIRVSTADAYLTGEVRSRRNLTIIDKAFVLRVLMEGGAARGVVFRQGSSDMSVLRSAPDEVLRCNKEVILCGGAVGSAHTLMLSGIGPAEQLRRCGVPVVKDLPVGQRLEDHLRVSMVWEVSTNDTLDKHTRFPKVLASLAQYLLTKSGPLSVTGGGMLFTRSQVSKEEFPDQEKPNDIQFHMGISSMKTVRLDQTAGITHSYMDHRGNDMRPDNGITLMPTLLQPFSVGRLELKSGDPFQHPEIEANYLADDRDTQVLVEAMKMCRTMMNHPSIKQYGVTREVLEPTIPHAPESDEYLRVLAKKECITVYHPTSTCKMGREDDPTAVVDASGRVLGVHGLRVADASVMPKVPSGNTHAPTIMVAEKIAHMMRQ